MFHVRLNGWHRVFTSRYFFQTCLYLGSSGSTIFPDRFSLETQCVFFLVMMWNLQTLVSRLRDYINYHICLNVDMFCFLWFTVEMTTFSLMYFFVLNLRSFVSEFWQNFLQFVNTKFSKLIIWNLQNYDNLLQHVLFAPWLEITMCIFRGEQQVQGAVWWPSGM